MLYVHRKLVVNGGKEGRLKEMIQVYMKVLG
jgi:hypothetical protein